MDRATTIDTPTAASSRTIDPHHTRFRRSARAARCPQVDRGRQVRADVDVGSSVPDVLTTVA
jgi:hypothetical protein